ncbi:hypothetical protein [Xenorhabdus griffiniae]|uniref:Uncharacterized protein n=1 Tax=Xenorhabdus griffiniae TaxID=351672 RepID=A0ABY9XND5_9GAMM|nr:hypothetical protein [Xenorhabdus griffiniae]MBD1228963.1 hypothetical protein [Xenorhabdus griffiniae]MBE8588657.1 hypothetical protein [Xenorhabdus griffiniae]WMV74334.1 hypothetical protein QL128_10240 [Xenorhabdus griffiniae]WNH04014.1 hypothetical protein QL112_010245 [Xenorhabdus griffiniae]
MRMGCHSGIQRLIVYSFCFLFLFVVYPSPVRANPAAVLLVRVIAQTVTKRAATRAVADVTARQAVSKYPLTELALQETIRRQAAAEAASTAAAMSRAAAARAASVPARSALRSGGKVTWAGLNIAGGVMTTSELIGAFRSGDLAVSTDGVALGNGKYEVRIGGRTQIVDFEPSDDQPVILYGNAIRGDTGVVVTPSRPVVVSGYLLNGDGLNSYIPLELPSGVFKSMSFDNYKVTYSFNISDDSGDYYFIEDDEPSSVQNAMIYASVKEFERQYKPVIYDAEGDNGNFKYVNTSYSVDILDFVSKAGSPFPSYPGVYEEIGGASTRYEATVPAVLHVRTLKNGFNPCEIVELATGETNIYGEPVTERKRMCTPPTDSDYIINDKKISNLVYLSLNTDYKSNYFKNKNKLNSVKSVSSSELADILDDESVDNAIVADLMTDLLHDAALQDDYQGIPVSDDDYISESEIADALRKLGKDKLTARDLFSPYQNIEIDQLTNNETTINSGNGKTDINVEAKVDLGENPNIKSPDLGELPTGRDIIDPIKNSMPFLSDFKLSGKNATCPTVDSHFSLMSHDFHLVIDTHCPLIEQNRTFIELIASLIWALVALRVLLSA